MLLQLLLLLFLCSPSQAQLCHPNDTLSFKNSFSNPNSLPSWAPQYHCCNWYGVECNDTTNRVIGLDISSLDLNGTIPPSLSNLKHLRHRRPNPTRNRPAPTAPDISWTNISGPIPKFLTNLKNLSYLILSFNRLSGPIPPSLPSLPYLYAIDLSRNHLTGPIPESFGHFLHTPSIGPFSQHAVGRHTRLSGQCQLLEDRIIKKQLVRRRLGVLWKG